MSVIKWINIAMDTDFSATVTELDVEACMVSRCSCSLLVQHLCHPGWFDTEDSK